MWPMPVSTDFMLLPAIDLRGNRVVRLEGGDFEHETVYGDDPVEVASRFRAAGARALHVVDLDGARAGAPRQAAVIGRIVAAVAPGTRCEVAGGLRTAQAVERALGRGAWRAVIGTRVLSDATFAARLVERHGAERVAVALDVRTGLAVGEAWLPGAAGRPVETVLAELAEVGVTTFEVTAIERDGLLGGPDLGLLGRLVAIGHGRIIASGGIATLDDLRAVRDIGCAGAIIGRALYEGRLDLAAALALASGQVPD